MAEQPAIQLCRRDVADHRSGPIDVAGLDLDAGRAAVPCDHVRHVDPGLAGAAVLADQSDQRVGEPCTAADGNRHSALLDRDRDHGGHVAGGGGVGPEARVEHPGCEQAVRARRRERLGQPVASRHEQAGGELGRAAASESPVGPQSEPGAVSRPQFGAEHAEREVGVREEVLEHRPPRSSVAALVPVELGGIRVGRPQEERGLPVRKQRRGRMIRVDVLEAVTREVVAEPGVRGAAHPERMPGAEDIMVKARLCDLGRLDRTAEPVAALEHADAAARFGEQCRAGETVHAAADDDDVVETAFRVHRRARGTRRP